MLTTSPNKVSKLTGKLAESDVMVHVRAPDLFTALLMFSEWLIMIFEFALNDVNKNSFDIIYMAFRTNPAAALFCYSIIPVIGVTLFKLVLCTLAKVVKRVDCFCLLITFSWRKLENKNRLKMKNHLSSQTSYNLQQASSIAN